MLGSSVLVMEAFTMGFALLIAMNSSDSWELILGGVLAIMLLLTPGLLKGKSGWVVGSLLQIPLIGYGMVVTSMYVLGGYSRSSGSPQFLSGGPVRLPELV